MLLISDERLPDRDREIHVASLVDRPLRWLIKADYRLYIYCS